MAQTDSQILDICVINETRNSVTINLTRVFFRAPLRQGSGGASARALSFARSGAAFSERERLFEDAASAFSSGGQKYHF